jgi:GDP-L-fucose synthase
LKLLITGAHGFLGHHVRPLLPDAWCPTKSELNLLDEDEVMFRVAQYEPDAILHMAARCGGILANKNSPADFLHDNVQMGLHVYQAALLSDCSRVYTLGSVCAYPKHCPVPFKEEDIWSGYPEETNAPYGIAKRVLLMLGQTYRAQYGMGGAHLVPVNLYGEHDHDSPVDSHVIPALIRKFTSGEDVTLWGTGNATREFLYAGDAAVAIARAVRESLDTNDPMNLGVGRDISIRDLASLMAELTGFTGKYEFSGEVSDGQPKRQLDTRRAKDRLGWEATTSLRDGLAKTIAWYRGPR